MTEEEEGVSCSPEVDDDDDDAACDCDDDGWDDEVGYSIASVCASASARLT